MFNTSRIAFLAGALLLGTIGFGTSSTAATCDPITIGGTSYDIDDGVTPNVGCFLGVTGTGGSGNDSAANLNTDMTFGNDDWFQIAKDDGLNGTETGDGSAFTIISGNLISGTLSIADSIFDLYGKVAVVLKSGGGNSNPDIWIAYEVKKIAGNYDYKSVFRNNNNGNQKNLSHISLYGSGTVSPVPLPAAGWLLIAGVGGLVALRRRNKAA